LKFVDPPPSTPRGAIGPYAERCSKVFCIFLKTVLILLALAVPAFLHASTLSGTIKDPSGAVIPDARIEITGGPKESRAEPVQRDSGKIGGGRKSTPIAEQKKKTSQSEHASYQATPSGVA